MQIKTDNYLKIFINYLITVILNKIYLNSAIFESW
jgi:hypothetical protein